MGRFRKNERSGGKSDRTSRFKKRDFSDNDSSERRPRSRGRGSSDRSPREFGSRGRSRRDERPEMHRVTCDKCHQRCEVPFKPTSSKPIYCSDCFRKTGGDSKSNELEEINKKLDKIIKGLDL